MFPPKSFANFSPEGGCSEGLDAFRFVFKKISPDIYRTLYVCTAVTKKQADRQTDREKNDSLYRTLCMCVLL